jgi:hypothetical protein
MFEVKAASPNDALTSLDLPLSESDLAGFPPSSRRAIVTFASWDSEGDPIAANVTTSGILTKFRFLTETTPVANCRGFDAPFEFSVTVAQKHRIIPLQISLTGFGGENVDLGPDQITAPVVSVTYLGVIPSDLDELVKSKGKPTSGNSFVWKSNAPALGGMWNFNLNAHSYTTPGAYLVTVEAGDDSYVIEPPGCDGIFVRKGKR